MRAVCLIEGDGGRVPLCNTTVPSSFGMSPDYRIKITPRGDQIKRELAKIVLYPRTVNGRRVESVLVNGKPIESFTDDIQTVFWIFYILLLVGLGLAELFQESLISL